MKKACIPVGFSNTYCPQALFLYGTYLGLEFTRSGAVWAHKRT